MKLLYSILISAILLLPSFGNVVIYLNFKINQDSIAKTLCVKKEIKNNHCNGKCYLAKQLKKAAEKEKEIPSNSIEKFELVYTQPHSEFRLTPSFGIKNKEKIFSSNSEKTQDNPLSIFHPPLV